MADRHHGYDVSVGYPSYFIREMGPDWLDFCIRAQGFDAQRTGPSYRYVDLGCGQGFHLCVLAAANPQAEFVGIDFESEHIAHGQELAAAGGLTNVTFIQADFLDLATAWPTELGAFDYIALQGILSWISPELRRAVIQCVAHASKPGTVASLGYNTPPGWLGAVPFQHVAQEFGKSRDQAAALEGTISMFRRLRDVNAPIFEQLPRFKRQLDVLAAQPMGYLAHEMLPDHWTPLWHSSVARDLRSAGFTYVGSAAVAEALLPDSIPPELRAVIVEQTDEFLRQDVQDIVIAQQFRRDIFCRSPRRTDRARLDGEAPIYLLSAPSDAAPVGFKTTYGVLTIDYAAVADIVTSLADGPKSVAELMALKNPARPDTRGILLAMLDAQMLMVGVAGPHSTEVADRFNAAVARAAAGGKSYLHVAAAALGSGEQATELDLLLLDTWLSADRSIDQPALAQGVLERLKRLGRELRFRGGALADEQLRPHVAQIASVFVDERVPQWRRLGILR